MDLLAFDTPEVLDRMERPRGPRELVSWSVRFPLAKQRSQTAFGSRVAAQALRVLRIRSPKKVRFCFDRSVRRQVMFARGVAGRSGVGRGKRWSRTVNSQYRC